MAAVEWYNVVCMCVGICGVLLWTCVWVYQDNNSISLTKWRLHIRLHAQLNLIKAIVRLCSSNGQLQLSEYTYRKSINWPKPTMSYPGTIGGAVPISTSGNKATSWPLCVTSNQKHRRHSRKMFSVDSCEFTSGPCHLKINVFFFRRVYDLINSLRRGRTDGDILWYYES